MGEFVPDLGNVAGQTYGQLLKRPEISLEGLLPVLRAEMAGVAELGFFDGTVNARMRNELKSVETEIKFAGYLDQQRKAIEKLKKAEQRAIPPGFEYRGLAGCHGRCRRRCRACGHRRWDRLAGYRG